MKTNIEAEWKELRAVVCSILIYFCTLAALAASISLFYFLPMGVIVGGYLLVCAGIVLVVLAVDHRPSGHRESSPLAPSGPEGTHRKSN